MYENDVSSPQKMDGKKQVSSLQCKTDGKNQVSFPQHSLVKKRIICDDDIIHDPPPAYFFEQLHIEHLILDSLNRNLLNNQ
jgi:hypothetical protein